MVLNPEILPAIQLPLCDLSSGLEIPRSGNFSHLQCSVVVPHPAKSTEWDSVYPGIKWLMEVLVNFAETANEGLRAKSP